MSVQRRLTVPVGRDRSTCMAQAYDGWFTGSRAAARQAASSAAGSGLIPQHSAPVEAVEHRAARTWKSLHFPAFPRP